MATGTYLFNGNLYLNYREQRNGRSISLKYFPGIKIDISKDKKAWEGGKVQKSKNPKINDKILDIKQAIKDVIAECSDMFKLNNDTFSKLINNKLSPRKLENKKAEIQQTPFYKYCDMFYEQVSIDIGERRAKTIKTTINKIKEFRPHLTFEQIDKKFYTDLVRWLNNLDLPNGKDKTKKMALNTVGTYIKELKRIMNYATDQGANKNLAYRDFKKPSEDVFNVYLTEKEIEKIYKLKITADTIKSLHMEEDDQGHWGGQHISSRIKALEQAKRLFVIGCWTGLRVECYLNIDPDIQIITEGKKTFLHAVLNKKGPKLKIPVHRFVREIVAEGWPKSISEQKFNDHIKILGRMAGISETVLYAKTEGGKRLEYAQQKYELITSHTARRSFASNLLIRGIPTRFIMAATGHKTEANFNKYVQQALKDVMTAKMADYDVWG
jgi:site-specific recombinase XerD